MPMPTKLTPSDVRDVLSKCHRRLIKYSECLLVAGSSDDDDCRDVARRLRKVAAQLSILNEGLASCDGLSFAAPSMSILWEAALTDAPTVALEDAPALGLKHAPALALEDAPAAQSQEATLTPPSRDTSTATQMAVATERGWSEVEAATDIDEDEFAQAHDWYAPSDAPSDPPVRFEWGLTHPRSPSSDTTLASIASDSSDLEPSTSATSSRSGKRRKTSTDDVGKQSAGLILSLFCYAVGRAGPRLR